MGPIIVVIIIKLGQNGRQNPSRQRGDWSHIPLCKRLLGYFMAFFFLLLFGVENMVPARPRVTIKH